jgi:site-specific recombinase XerD
MNPYSKAGIRKRVGVYTLRHTFGAHKAEKTWVLRHCKS